MRICILIISEIVIESSFWFFHSVFLFFSFFLLSYLSLSVSFHTFLSFINYFSSFFLNTILYESRIQVENNSKDEEKEDGKKEERRKRKMREEERRKKRKNRRKRKKEQKVEWKSWFGPEMIKIRFFSSFRLITDSRLVSSFLSSFHHQSFSSFSFSVSSFLSFFLFVSCRGSLSH